MIPLDYTEPLTSTHESPISIAPRDCTTTTPLESASHTCGRACGLPRGPAQPAAQTAAPATCSCSADHPCPLAVFTALSHTVFTSNSPGILLSSSLPHTKGTPAHLTLPFCPGTEPPRQESMIRPRQRHMKCSTAACQRQGQIRTLQTLHISRHL
jgi:hypothetical protein